MIDWLLKRENTDPTVDVAGRLLPLVIRRNAQARRMTMRLAPDGSEVRVTLPTWGRSAEALDFARSRAGWLAGQLAAVPEAVELGHGAAIPYLGQPHVIRHDPAQPRKVALGEGELIVGGPAASLPSRLKRWLAGEARRLMTDDLSYYCLRAGQPQQSLMLTNAKRRWGSCARDGTIRINWRLVMAPSYVRRSVVAHEVAHLVHFDHSPAFHAYLDEIFEGEIRMANRWLKREGKSLYLPMS
ncbi:SprT family zinc-dependent metalloprotease [Novosphingobium sp.]|uniref:M48 family metallopeptidase n=1 Tax=Novosphingobium sp. TaxID=1874826 RepID=UPI00286B381E|nr:SprT family zinc-dependent metalloprotease [Novosphingobium sp.]